METILELRQQRAKDIADGRAIVDAAEKRGSPMTAEENANFDKAMDAADAKGKLIAEREGETERRSRLDDAERALKESRGRRTDPGQPGAQPEANIEFRARFGHLSRRELALMEERSTPEYRTNYARWLMTGERRDLQAGGDTQGGYLSAPIQFVDEFIVWKKNLVFVRQLATVKTVTEAQGLGAPSLDVDISTPVWTSEIAVGNNDTAMRFGKREMFPHPLAKEIKISNKLLRVNVVSAEGEVRDRLGYQFATTEEFAFLQGNGNEQPLGVYTPSPMGISTGRDVMTATAGALGADDIIETKYNLKQQYLNADSLRWILNRTVVKTIRKLKYGTGEYIWQPGLQVGRPDMLLDVPVAMSEYAPGSIATGNYVAVLGDFKFYWIADSLNLTIQRLNELYAQTNQTGFIAREEVDGMPVLEEAFSRLKVS